MSLAGRMEKRKWSHKFRTGFFLCNCHLLLKLVKTGKVYPKNLINNPFELLAANALNTNHLLGQLVVGRIFALIYFYFLSQKVIFSEVHIFKDRTRGTGEKV